MARKTHKRKQPVDMGRERRRSLCRFAMALSDIHAATSVCDLMLEERPGMGDAHYWAYHNAIINSYGRPFTTMKPIGKLPTSVLRGLTPRERQIHDDILEHRNTMAAHSDLNAKPVYYMPKGAAMGETGMRAEGGGFVTSNTGWSFALWAEVKELTMVVGSVVQAEAMRLVDLVYPPGFYAPTMIKIEVD